MPSSGIARNLDFTVRLDSDYRIYWFMHRLFPGDSQGNFDLNLYKSYSNQANPYLSRIQVKALKPNPRVTLTQLDPVPQSSGGYDIVYSWTFFDCILYKIPQIQLGQDTSGPVTGVYSFKFGNMQEGPGTKGLLKSITDQTFFTLSSRDSLLDSAFEETTVNPEPRSESAPLNLDRTALRNSPLAIQPEINTNLA
jgi:hypothetical protein